jgi:hypothetical protein
MYHRIVYNPTNAKLRLDYVNEVKAMISQEKYYSKKFNSLKCDNRKIWAESNDLMGKNKKNVCGRCNRKVKTNIVKCKITDPSQYCL